MIDKSMDNRIACLVDKIADDDKSYLCNFLLLNIKKVELLEYALTYGGYRTKVRKINEDSGIKWEATYFNSKGEKVHTFFL